LSRKDGGKLARLTTKQKEFADEYILSGNAMQSAIKVGYSLNYAKSQSHKLLENVGIKSYIDERMKEIESKKSATQQEVIEYLTSVMRGEHKEEILIGQGQGFQEITYIDVSAKDRLKAANLLNKIHQARESKQDETKKEDKLDAYIAKVDGELDEFI
jgi:phage terminase (fragment)